MIGIVVPETCQAYKKYNKIISCIWLVFILQLRQNGITAIIFRKLSLFRKFCKVDCIAGCILHWHCTSSWLNYYSCFTDWCHCILLCMSVSVCLSVCLSVHSNLLLDRQLLGKIRCVESLTILYNTTGIYTNWKITTGTPTGKWEYNIKMDLKEIGWECVDQIYLTYDR